MSLLDPRTYYKPFSYPFCYEAYEKQAQMHWLPSEVPLAEDVRDWNSKLTPPEKNLLTSLFRFFTQADVDVAGGYSKHFLPKFPAPEVRMMLLQFAAMESIHINAYALLIDTLGMPNDIYKTFMEFQEMREKHEYLENFNTTSKKELAKSLAIFSGFTEGIQLFSSFAILLNFSRFGKMKGMGQIITFSVKDESLHVESMSKLFRIFIEENPKIWTEEFKTDLHNICKTVVELEDKFIDLAFSGGGIEGLTPQEVKKYIRYIADRRLLGLGLPTLFKVKNNPLSWLDHILNGIEHANFFESRATEYAKGSLTGSWEEVFPIN